MHRKTRATLPEPIRDLIQEIRTKVEQSDDQVITAAMKIRELRQRIESGEVGKVNWYVWALKHIKLKKTRLRELVSIAESPDPRKELQRLRNLALERKDRYRTRHATERDLDPARQAIIAWAKKATLAEVEEIYRRIRERTNGVIAPAVERLETPAVMAAQEFGSGQLELAIDAKDAAITA